MPVYGGFPADEATRVNGVSLVPDRNEPESDAFQGFPVRDEKELRNYHRRGGFAYRVSIEGSFAPVARCERHDEETFDELRHYLKQGHGVLVHPDGLDDGEA